MIIQILKQEQMTNANDYTSTKNDKMQMKNANDYTSTKNDK